MKYPLLVFLSVFYFFSIQAQSVAPLFATPTPSEIAAVQADWAARDVNAYNWTVVGSGLYNGMTVEVVSHDVVGGDIHYGFVRYPINYAPTGSYPVVVANHGGQGGVGLGILATYSTDCLQNFIVVVPSFRSEELRTDALGLGNFVSGGAPSEFDGDIDDALALLNGTLDNVAGADTARIAIAGGSRGGGVTYLMCARDSRVKAAVVLFGATDHITLPGLEATIQGLVDSGSSAGPPPIQTVMNVVDPYLAGTLPLADARLALIRRSVIYFANQLPQPLNVHHGTDDLVVEIIHSQLMVTEMANLGVMAPDFEYYEYLGGGHGNNMPGSTELMQDLICTLADTTTTTTPVMGNIFITANVFLEGAYNPATQMMEAALSGNLPLTQPYNRTPWNYNGTESVANMPADVVDWVLVEIRDGNDIDVIVRQQAGLLLTDGTVVGFPYSNIPTIDDILFVDMVMDYPYYMVIRHRNHLAVASVTALTLPSATPFDFNDPNNVMGMGQLADFGDGNYGILAGDYNSDGVLSVSDFNGYLTESSAVNVYFDGDFGLNGTVTVTDFNLFQPNSSTIGVEVVRY